MIMARTIVSMSQLCLSRQQQEFLSKYRTAAAMQAYLDSYGEGESNFLDSTSSGNISKPVVPDSPLPYDFEVEFLETNYDSGFAYIDTGIIPKGQDIYIRIEYILYSTLNSVESSIFGTTASSLYENYIWTRVPNSSTDLRLNYSSGVVIFYNGEFGKFSVLECFPGGTANLNGVSRTMRFPELLPNNTNLLLFPSKSSSSAHLRIFSFSLSDNDIPLVDMIPVSVDGVGYMYDKVRKELFGAQGGGSFVVGPRKA